MDDQPGKQNQKELDNEGKKGKRHTGFPN